MSRQNACHERHLSSLCMLYCEISHHKINTATGRKKSKVVQGSSRQRSNKRDNMSQMLLGLCIVSPVGNKCLPLRLSGKSLELLVPSSASVESSERAKIAMDLPSNICDMLSRLLLRCLELSWTTLDLCFASCCIYVVVRNSQSEPWTSNHHAKTTLDR